MKNIKLLTKLLALLLALFTVLSFVGCGNLFKKGDKQENTSDVSDDTSDVTDSTKDTEGDTESTAAESESATDTDSDTEEAEDDTAESDTESSDVTDVEDTESAEDTESETETEEIGDVFELEDLGLDYKGADFLILVRDSDEHKSDFAADFEGISAGMTALDMAVFKRNAAVKNLLNINFVFVPAKQSGDESLDKVLSNNIASGMEMYHLVANHGQYTFDHIQNLEAVDWNSIDYVNLENSWWNQSAREVWATPGGKVFAMNGDLSYLSVGNMSGIYYNKTIFEEAGIKSPVEFVKEDAWTLDNFKTTVKDVDATLIGDGSGTIETDTFAFAAQRYRAGVIVRATGAEHLKLGENGQYYVDIYNNTRVVDAFESYQELFTNGLAYYETRDIATKGGLRDRFKNESIAMTIDNLKCARDFAGNGTNFGIVPIFKYDDAVESYPSSIGSGTNTFMIPITTKVETRDMIGAVVEAMAYFGQKDVIPAYYEQILLTQTTQSVEDREMLELIHDTATVDFASYGNFGKITEIEWRTFEGEYSSLTNAIEATHSKALTEIGEFWYTLDDWWEMTY